MPVGGRRVADQGNNDGKEAATMAADMRIRRARWDAAITVANAAVAEVVRILQEDIPADHPHDLQETERRVVLICVESAEEGLLNAARHLRDFAATAKELER